MNYKNRIRNLERKMNMKNKLNYIDLIQPDFKYSGHAFENTDEVFQHFHIKNKPEGFTNAELETLYKNGLLKYSIEQTLKAINENI